MWNVLKIAKPLWNFFIPLIPAERSSIADSSIFHSSRTRVRETGSSVQRCNVASLKGRTGGLRDIFWLIEAVLHRSKPLSTYTHRADAFTGNKFCQKRSVCNVLGTFHIGKGIVHKRWRLNLRTWPCLDYYIWKIFKGSIFVGRLWNRQRAWVYLYTRIQKKNLSGIITKINHLIINVITFLSNIIEKHNNVLLTTAKTIKNVFC